MEKKNTGLIFVIVILALVVGLLGGYIMANKLIDKQPEQSENNNNKTNDDKNIENNNNQDNKVEKEYNLADAKKLMNKYKGISRDYITNMSDEEKLVVEIYNTTVSEVKYCGDDALTSVVQGNTNAPGCRVVGSQSIWDYTVKFSVYRYSELLKTAKQLFGSDESISKNISIDNPTFIRFVNGIDSYIYDVDGARIIDDSNKTHFSTITSAKIVDGTLKIHVNSIANYKITYETYENDEYEYSFKESNNEYYLAEITKIK